MTTATSETPKRRIVFRWRVVDIIVAAVIGVAFGVVFYGWDLVYAIPTKPLELLLPGTQALLGAQWGGFQTILQGIVQGLGAEVIFAILLYSSWRLWTAILAGAASGASMAINDFINSYAGATVAFKASYGISAVVSGAIIAGVGSWFLVRALARTGALSRFAAGRETTVVTSSAKG